MFFIQTANTLALYLETFKKKKKKKIRGVYVYYKSTIYSKTDINLLFQHAHIWKQESHHKSHLWRKKKYLQYFYLF